jgi:hypothetical protein
VLVYIEVVMMATKTFIETNGLKLISDERDIMVPSEYYQDVVDWCNTNHVDVTVPQGTYSHTTAAQIFKVNLWRVKNPEQRLLFVLRWS